MIAAMPNSTATQPTLAGLFFATLPHLLSDSGPKLLVPDVEGERIDVIRNRGTPLTTSRKVAPVASPLWP